MSEPDADEVAARALLVCARIEPMLKGQGPDVQGAVLAHLTALWVCGHHPASFRPAILFTHYALTRDMIEDMTK